MKKAVLNTTTLTHRKVRHTLREMTFVKGATKINLKPQTIEYLAMTG